MKKIISNSIIIFSLLYVIFLSGNSVLAKSNFSSPPTRKLLAWSGWDKAVSWFKKSTPPPVLVIPKVVPAKKSDTSVVNKKNLPKQQAVVNKKTVGKTNISATPGKVFVQPFVGNSVALLDTLDKKINSDKIISVYVAPTNPEVVDVGSFNSERSMTIAKGINNKGVVVGDSEKNNRSPGTPFLFKNGIIKNIGGGYYGTANAINDNDQVVGQLLEPNNVGIFSGMVRPFLWENDKITKIGKSPGISLDINNKKQIVGFMWIGQYEGYPVHSFIWEKGVTKDLGTLGGDDDGGATTANAINNVGQVVGCSIAKDGFQHPFLWENGKMKNLGNLYNEGGCAVDINDSGQIVGYFYKKDKNPKYRIIEPFIWEKDQLNPLTDAPKNFWPYKINNHGDIVGAYNGLTIRKNGIYSSYLELSGWSLDVNDGVGFNDNRQVAASGNRAENNFKYGLMISLPDNMPDIKAKVQNIIKIEPMEEPRDPNTAYPVLVPAPAQNF